MLFNSLNFVVFFPIFLFVYWLIPDGFRRIWLLAASWFFCACFDPRCLAVLIGITLVTYAGGIILEKNRSRVLIVCTVAICLLTLGIFKYLGFITNNINAILARVHVSFTLSAFSLFVPAGISFYTFKGIGYVTDVYRGQEKAESSFLDHALFIAFFPQLIAGPIDRASSLLRQIKEPRRFSEEDFKAGALLMLYGYFEKLIVADRISIIVDRIYGDHMSYSGAAIVLATLCYGIQIYTDFAGYSYISVGAARILGFKVADNFRQPYFATDIKDFWKRWHISMSSWFRDYVYIPLGGNRKGRWRKLVNNMVTFLLSGLWHGSAWNFVVWGGLHGLYNMVSELTSGYRKRLGEKLGIKEDTFGRRFFKVIMTFIIVDYAWMFFRAGSLSAAVSMTGQILNDFRLYTITADFIKDLGTTGAMLNSMILSLMFILFIDIVHEKGFSIIKWLEEQGTVFRWLCYIGAVLIVILSAIQNLGQSSNAFIYFNF